jgi:hypothetical protein
MKELTLLFRLTGPAGEGIKAPVVMRDRCPAHEDERLKGYCETCRCAICSSCAMFEHRDASHMCVMILMG